MLTLSDSFNRHFYYLRLSLTDICNFRCSYCLPNGCKSYHKNSLSLDEIRRLVTAFTELGVRKIRLTGGEPTTRKNFTDIASTVANIPDVKKLAFTTNGYQLEERAEEFFNAGLRHINVSVDSLQAEKFKAITGHNRLNSILKGIDKSLQLGFDSVKINVVLLKNVNDDEIADFLDYVKNKPISIRFIELMQTGDNYIYFKKHHLSADTIRKNLQKNDWQQQLREVDSGPAIEFSHADYQGLVGLIAPYSPNFCQTCNRLRISSQGVLHLCLFSKHGYDLRHYLQADNQKDLLIQEIQKVITHKKSSHSLLQGFTGSTQQLAQIGG